jgi:hypothetical protein
MDTVYNNFANYFDSDFFFGRSALQNYLSEILSIILTIFVVDQVIRFRHKRINRPLRNIGYVRLFDELDDFINDFVPVTFYQAPDIRSLMFGNYKTFVIRTLKNFTVYELCNNIRESEEAAVRSVNLYEKDTEQYNESIKRLHERAEKLTTFEDRIQFIIGQYSMHFQNDEVQMLNEICFQINQHFSVYKYNVASTGEAERIGLPYVVPEVAVKAVALWQKLLAIGVNNFSKKHKN